MKKWEYQYQSDTNGKVYHKGNDIMVVYNNRLIRLFKNIQNDKKYNQGFYPCFAEYYLERKIGYK